MYGAILGDIIGSPYERHNIKTTDFTLFSPYSRYTDDTVMTLAIADGIMNAGLKAPVQVIKQEMMKSMQKFGRKYPSAGYGKAFSEWIHSDAPRPYNSWGNGAAMRVSSIAWLFADDYAKMRSVARASAEITHNHPDGIKAADATVCLIWLAKNKREKTRIKEFAERNFGYKLELTCDEIRPTYQFDVSCRGTMPAAITAFLEGDSFEEVVRLAVSLGGDSDTIAAIAGSIADAYYEIPDSLKTECNQRLPGDLLEVLGRFEDFMNDWDKGIERGRRAIPAAFIGFPKEEPRSSSKTLPCDVDKMNQMVAKMEQEGFFIDYIYLGGQGEWDVGIIEYDENYDNLSDFVKYARSDYDAIKDMYHGHEADWSETSYYLYHACGMTLKIRCFMESRQAHWTLTVAADCADRDFANKIESMLNAYSI